MSFTPEESAEIDRLETLLVKTLGHDENSREPNWVETCETILNEIHAIMYRRVRKNTKERKS